MKILHLAMQYPPMWGGIETFVCSLAEDAMVRGHEVQVLACHGMIELPDFLVYNGVPVHRVPLADGVDRQDPRLLLQARQRIRKMWQDFQPDVLHVHIGGPILLAYTLCPEIHEVPMLATVHDLPRETPEQHPTVLAVLRRAGWILANSDIRFKETLTWIPDRADRVERIYVTKPPLSAAPPVLRSTHPLILMTGRHVFKKGFDLAIYAFNEVAGRHPEARMVLVGDGEQHAALHQLVKDLGLTERVEFTGRISTDELAAWYQRAWFTLIPSRHSESFGLVTLEAMQAGTPTIGSRIGGIPEVIDEGVTGRLVEPSSVEDLARAMRELLENPSRCRAMGQAAFERAERLFNWSFCAERHAEIYQQILAE